MSRIMTSDDERLANVARISASLALEASRSLSRAKVAIRHNPIVTTQSGLPTFASLFDVVDFSL